MPRGRVIEIRLATPRRREPVVYVEPMFIDSSEAASPRWPRPSSCQETPGAEKTIGHSGSGSGAAAAAAREIGLIARAHGVGVGVAQKTRRTGLDRRPIDPRSCTAARVGSEGREKNDAE